MKFFICLFILFCSSYSLALRSGGQEAGGGGFVHDNFINYGKQVLYYLKNNPKGKSLVKRNKLNLCRLKKTLNENLIYVYDDKQMIDHRGSIVDAYSYRWAIYILNHSWKKYFTHQTEIHYLVLKEMLRSEGTHFHRAIDIANEINPIDFDFKSISLQEQNEFLNWFETNNTSCLSYKDTETIENNINSHLANIQYEAPNCFQQLVPETDWPILSSIEDQVSNRLLEGVRSTKCQVETSPCQIKNSVKAEKGIEYLLKSIYWKGKPIYTTILAAKDQQTNQRLNIPNDVNRYIENDLLRMTLQDLKFAKICESEEKDDVSIPEYVILKEHPIFKDFMPFEYLRPDNFTDCPFCKNENSLIIGTGSKLKLLSHEVRTSNFQAKFVKVKVLENKRQRPINNATYAKAGDEGWILLSFTDYHYYYNPDFDMLTDR